MGTGIDAAREEGPAHAALMDNMKDQLILVLFRRLGRALNLSSGTTQEFIIPVAEVDGTGGLVLSFKVDFEKRDFIFSLSKKQ